MTTCQARQASPRAQPKNYVLEEIGEPGPEVEAITEANGPLGAFVGPDLSVVADLARITIGRWGGRSRDRVSGGRSGAATPAWQASGWRKRMFSTLGPSTMMPTIKSGDHVIKRPDHQGRRRHGAYRTVRGRHLSRAAKVSRSASAIGCPVESS